MPKILDNCIMVKCKDCRYLTFGIKNCSAADYNVCSKKGQKFSEEKPVNTDTIDVDCPLKEVTVENFNATEAGDIEQVITVYKR